MSNPQDSQTELLGYHVLEASAGTGKTFAIQHICTRLLLEKNMQWEDILIVTFTKEACALLKSRVRKTLEESVHPLRTHHLAHIDKMQIFTIHGFCYRALNTWAFDANTPFARIEPEKARPRLIRCVEDVLRTKECANLYSPSQMNILLDGKDVHSLINNVLSEKPTYKVHHTTLEDIDTHLRLQKPFDLLLEFEKATNVFKGLKRKEFIEQAELLHTLLQKNIDTKEALDTLISYEEIFFAKMHPGNKKIKALAEGFENLEALRLSLYPLILQAKDPKLLLQSLTYLCQKHMAKIGLGTYDTLLTQMHLCVKNINFANKLRAQYKAVIIDEFQDTDALQWEIFKDVFLGHVSAFYVVGDPKQAIYGFRLADVYTYLGAKKELQDVWGAGITALSTNYRSNPQLVSALNMLFSKAGNWMPLPALGCSLDVPSVSAGILESDIKNEPAVHFFASSSTPAEEDFFSFIAQEIVKWPLDECAILVRDRYQAKKAHAFLEEKGINATLTRPGSLLESDAWHSMEEILEALQDPFDIRKVRSAALGPHMLCPPEEASSLFLGWHKTWKSKGFVFFYKEFIKKFPQDGDFQQLADLLMNGETLKSLSLLDPDDPQLAISLSSGTGVRILTMHMSKGLEFPVVFALGLAKKSSEKEEEKLAEDMRLLYVTLTRAKRQLYIPLPLKGRFDTPVERFYAHIDPTMSAEGLSDMPIGYTIITKSEPTLVLKQPNIEIEQKGPLQIPEYTPRFILSFSSISEKHTLPLASNLAAPLIPTGPETGIILHRILERLFTGNEDRCKLISSCIQGTHLEQHNQAIENLIEEIMEISLDAFSVRDIEKHKARTEMEFFFPIDGGMMKGVIDLFFYMQGKYYLLDWKTNHLESYCQKHLKATMEEKEYFLQGKIYIQAAKRYIRLFDKRPFEESFGGMFYVFVRGSSVYHLLY